MNINSLILPANGEDLPVNTGGAFYRPELFSGGTSATGKFYNPTFTDKYFGYGVVFRE